MELTTIQIQKLVASTGFVLTNGEVYSKEVYLGCNDKPENWHEITEEEYNLILEEELNSTLEEEEGEVDVLS